MITEINIINSALIKLGIDIINSRTQDNNKAARTMNQLYDLKRQELLRMHPWNFATSRQSLALLTTDPAFEYSYEFQLPDDCLRVVRINNPYQEYKIEGRTILTNSSTCDIIYIADIDDTSLFDPLFASALADFLAFKAALSLTGSTAIQAQLGQEFQVALRTAKQIDGQEDSHSQLLTDSWTVDR
jgi:hypothetical protein